RLDGTFLLGLQFASPRIDGVALRTRLRPELHERYLQPRYDTCAERQEVLRLRAKRDELVRQQQLASADLERLALDRRRAALDLGPAELTAEVARIAAAEAQVTAQLADLKAAEEALAAPLAEATEKARAAMSVLQREAQQEAMAAVRARLDEVNARLAELAGPLLEELIALDLEKQTAVRVLADEGALTRLLGPEPPRPPALAHLDPFLRKGEKPSAGPRELNTLVGSKPGIYPQGNQGPGPQP